MIKRAGNACPSCGRRINLWDVAFGPDNVAFKCGRCGSRLAKGTFLKPLLPVVIIAIVAVRLVLGRWTTEANIATGAIVLAGVAIAWFTVRVRPAEAGLPDRRPAPFDLETREGPPPVDPHFRGSSGPPPRQKD